MIKSDKSLTELKKQMKLLEDLIEIQLIFGLLHLESGFNLTEND